MKNSILTLSGLLLSFALFGQQPVPGNNDERKADLMEAGVKIERPSLHAWFPKDSVSSERMEQICDSLSMQVDLARKFMGAPRSWQVFGTAPVTMYFSRGTFVANTSVAGEVYMPLWRMKKNRAPYLHEIMHVLLRSTAGNWNDAPREEVAQQMPLWFTEGMPEYIALRIATDNKFPKFDLHKGGGYAKVDETCARVMKTDVGKIIDPYLGGKGVLMELFGNNRGEYSPAFYTCSCSLTKYLAEKYGLELMLTAISSFKQELQTIEKSTGKTMLTLKDEWMASLPKQ